MADREIPTSEKYGLCPSCAHVKVVPNTRGSLFLLCQRAKTDARYRKYPAMPVIKCPGHELTDSASEGGGTI